MAPTTTGELKRWLDAKGWSPETLAGHVPVSNMTWRRLLAKPADAPLPAKYRALLASLEPGGSVPAGEGLDPVDVVLSGMRQTRAEVLTGMSADGAAVAAPRRLLTESWKRVGSGPLPRRLVALVKDLRQHYGVVGKAGQVLILGGLAYFLNPFDLIADSIVSVGLVDDLGVLALIHGRLLPKKGRQA